MRLPTDEEYEASHRRRGNKGSAQAGALIVLALFLLLLVTILIKSNSP